MKFFYNYLLLTGMLVLSFSASAQEMSDSYERLSPPALTPEVLSDTMLFYSPLGERRGLFESFTRWNFGWILYRPRGVEFRNEEVQMWGLPRRVELNDAPRFQTNLSYNQQRYAFGVDAATAFQTRSAGHRLFISTRQGPDGVIDGVATNSFSGSWTTEREFAGGIRGSLFVAASHIIEGQRGWTADEVFELAGNRFYNPTWGWLDGRRINSRERRNSPLLTELEVDFPMGINLQARWTGGERTLTGLSWFDAANPAPDYYTKLPSHFADERGIEQVWKSGDSRYTQINWEAMIRANRASGSSSFVADERVERPNNFTLQASYEAYLYDNLTVAGGARLNYNHSANFRRVRSLLGGAYIYNIDNFLVDDDDFGDRIENDLRTSGRKIYTGDRFGYDYTVHKPSAELFGSLGGRIERFEWRTLTTLTVSQLWRQGHYEKATFPGSDSFGNSRKLRFTTFSLSANANYTIAPNHHLLALLNFGSLVPDADNIFLSPQSNNFTAPALRGENFINFELTWSGFPLTWLTLETTGYIAFNSRQTHIYRYYDDAYRLYSVATLSNISTLHTGIEAAAEATLTRRLTLRFAGSLNRYIYTSNPALNIYADVDLHPLLTASHSFINGMTASPSPQNTAIVSLRYSTPSGWLAEISVAFAGGRYIVPDPTRRTTRTTQLASSPEILNDFLVQQSLADATNIRFYLSRRWQRWQFSLSVNNLLNSSTVYGAYEQMRIRYLGLYPNRTYLPAANRLLYSYPRTVLISVSYRL